MLNRTSMLTRLLAGAAATAALAAAAPSFAQTVDEITVMGALGPDGRPTQLSRAVPIGDLDLRYDGAVAEARARVREAAHDICRELGEGGGRSPISGSCEQDAIRSASDQIRIAVADARSGPAYAVVDPAPVPYAGPTAEEEDLAAAEAAASVGDASADASATVPDYSSTTTVTTTTVTNGVVPDTPENRARYGGPLSNGGQQTAPRGN